MGWPHNEPIPWKTFPYHNVNTTNTDISMELYRSWFFAFSKHFQMAHIGCRSYGNSSTWGCIIWYVRKNVLREAQGKVTPFLVWNVIRDTNWLSLYDSQHQRCYCYLYHIGPDYFRHINHCRYYWCMLINSNISEWVYEMYITKTKIKTLCFVKRILKTSGGKKVNPSQFWIGPQLFAAPDSWWRHQMETFSA